MKVTITLEGDTLTSIFDRLAKDLNLGGEKYITGERPTLTSAKTQASPGSCTLAFSPIAGSISVYFDGLRFSEGIEFSVKDRMITFDPVIPVAIDSVILVDYRA